MDMRCRIEDEWSATFGPSTCALGWQIELWMRAAQALVSVKLNHAELRFAIAIFSRDPLARGEAVSAWPPRPWPFWLTMLISARHN